ncbi:DUF2961 domain-containing protein, partial [bacterium]|nr:DUF2961 domain-containing protein [bacterium]
LETRGRGHYLGGNLSVTNLQGTWWGEGDDMIWVDGYKWPPDLHGTGSEDYLNQAWGMQPNAFLRNGSSVFEGNFLQKGTTLGSGAGGYQTAYIHHLENPVRFQKEIKVTIEHGHANHLANEMSSTAYWYAAKPTPVLAPPPVAQRRPFRKVKGKWMIEAAARCPGQPVTVTAEMRQRKAAWRIDQNIVRNGRLGPWWSPFVTRWFASKLVPPRDLSTAPPVRLSSKRGWKKVRPGPQDPFFVSVHGRSRGQDGLVYLARKFRVGRAGDWILHLGHDGGAKAFVDGQPVLCEPGRVNPCPRTRSRARIKLAKGTHEIVIAFDTDGGNGWGICFSFEVPADRRRAGPKPQFPKPG